MPPTDRTNARERQSTPPNMTRQEALQARIEDALRRIEAHESRAGTPPAWVTQIVDAVQRHSDAMGVAINAFGAQLMEKLDELSAAIASQSGTVDEVKSLVVDVVSQALDKQAAQTAQIATLTAALGAVDSKAAAALASVTESQTDLTTTLTALRDAVASANPVDPAPVDEGEGDENPVNPANPDTDPAPLDPAQQ